METLQTFTVHLSEEQKQLFDKWLEDVEKDLNVRLKGIRSLRSQVQNSTEPVMTSSKKKSKVEKSAQQSWTSKVIQVLKQSQSPQTSVQVVAWLMEHDAELKNKDRRYVTKNVTSKLSLLVDKHTVIKDKKDGKNVYVLQ